MIHLFNSESIYIGTDVKRFNWIRELLEANQIRYKYKVKNRMGQWVYHGTVRGHTGSVGLPTEKMYEYEVLIHKKDKKAWNYLQGQLR
ncbi:MAG: hypothetical protein KHY46_06195 [Clostridiales bacterium]|nr:hypothetical protein [Clostridiales bacterium]